jgi:cell wall-associated NlpC family hydrolase
VWLFHRVALGNAIPRYAGYQDAEGPDIPDRIRQGWADWAIVPLGRETTGDVLALRIGEHAVHVGVVVAPGTMLHVLEGRCACLESYVHRPWSLALARIGRWTS